MNLFSNTLKRSRRQPTGTLSQLSDRQLDDLGLSRADVGPGVRTATPIPPNEAWTHSS